MVEIKIVESALSANERNAARNREAFAEAKVFVLNVMSSPGSGKTLLLEKTVAALRERYRIAVVVGDITTTRDAERLSLGGSIPVTQICTEPFGGDCHLDAHIVLDAAGEVNYTDCDLLIVENVGNLVCPAEFDIGEDRRVVVLSVTEGEDKPLKYPLMFRVCDACILNKVDLLPHLHYDVEQTRCNIESIHAGMPVMPLSAQSGDGLDLWLDWLALHIDAKRNA